MVRSSSIPFDLCDLYKPAPVYCILQYVGATLVFPSTYPKSPCSRESVMVLSLDLQSFIVRARVLKLYRQALRITRRAPVDSRAELRRMIRQEMESNRNCSDKQRIRFLMSEALERLKRLDEMLDMQGH
ncbi:hypothetical protein RJ640_020793 [Escallonia rubra]|uniref:LYR motif-containing protein 2 n=1 Tax=Escallonia rubra TaxID=112253 RepID=A0AA88U8V1_9ASTE|nr:hypothetical protein RJ640_020793 [Escallonia rubra]